MFLLFFLLWLVLSGSADLHVCLWGLAAFAGASVLATCLSLKPTWSAWGLGSYYGGLALVLVFSTDPARRPIRPERWGEYLPLILDGGDKHG